jgi:hypothetical protein
MIHLHEYERGHIPFGLIRLTVDEIIGDYPVSTSSTSLPDLLPSNQEWS